MDYCLEPSEKSQYAHSFAAKTEVSMSFWGFFETCLVWDWIGSCAICFHRENACLLLQYGHIKQLCNINT